MKDPIPPSRAILKVAIGMAMRAGDQDEVRRLKLLYLQQGKHFGGHRGNPMRAKWTKTQKALRLAANSGTTKKQKPQINND